MNNLYGHESWNSGFNYNLVPGYLKLTFWCSKIDSFIEWEKTYVHLTLNHQVLPIESGAIPISWWWWWCKASQHNYLIHHSFNCKAAARQSDSEKKEKYRNKGDIEIISSSQKLKRMSFNSWVRVQASRQLQFHFAEPEEWDNKLNYGRFRSKGRHICALKKKKTERQNGQSGGRETHLMRMLFVCYMLSRVDGNLIEIHQHNGEEREKKEGKAATDK